MTLTLLLLNPRFSSSSKFLLTVLLWSLPTFLLSLLSFLVDLILFIPHLEWCGWTILMSALCSAICGTMLCITRRTITSREEYLLLDNRMGNMYRLDDLHKDSSQSVISTLAPTLLRSRASSSMYTQDPDMLSDDELVSIDSDRRVDLRSNVS
ncbi:uncharacterized protein OGAPODRAFT_15981 [Ogataea polymorpha]|uniref:uncharacterized protein n=1 Tax=Ogataea polymorpha TaxID=460523 RepID=UPI0007F37A4E|nr:uncharacterized protein OGAPODRAFT_15981 [Ogataea polymorpha]OBA16162.1 hypothetical protein OGAPODRAFT_15981 [Ogataea polymorpha]